MWFPPPWPGKAVGAKKDLLSFSGLAFEFIENNASSFSSFSSFSASPLFLGKEYKFISLNSCFFWIETCLKTLSYLLSPYPQLKHLGVQDNFLQQLHHCIATRALLVVLEALWRSHTQGLTHEGAVDGESVCAISKIYPETLGKLSYCHVTTAECCSNIISLPTKSSNTNVDVSKNSRNPKNPTKPYYINQLNHTTVYKSTRCIFLGWSHPASGTSELCTKAGASW